MAIYFRGMGVNKVLRSIGIFQRVNKTMYESRMLLTLSNDRSLNPLHEVSANYIFVSFSRICRLLFGVLALQDVLMSEM